MLIWLSLPGSWCQAESTTVQSATQDALQAGRALCKVVSPTDAGRTGSHQSGLYLPKQAWRFFTTSAPVEEQNRREAVEITWTDGGKTDAVISWYGKGSRSEFRLTKLGDRLGPDNVGDLLVLVPQGPGKFQAHLLPTDEAALAFSTALGIEPAQRWGFYEKSPAVNTEPGSLEAWAQREAALHPEFPSGRIMAGLARKAVQECRPDILSQSADHRLMAWLEAEYVLYRAVERRLCDQQVKQDFASVEEFLATAATLMNRRKARAGHSLEAHVEHLLSGEGIAFEAQATIDGNGKPDILFPGKAAYGNEAHPVDELVVLGLKTTCRDRWRQVLNEGKRIPQKHLLTLQPAMSRAQLTEMGEARLQLVVPAALHRGYDLPEGYQLLSVETFVQDMRRRFPR